jgi:hypothetical protein
MVYYLNIQPISVLVQYFIHFPPVLQARREFNQIKLLTEFFSRVYFVVHETLAAFNF